MEDYDYDEEFDQPCDDCGYLPCKCHLKCDDCGEVRCQCDMVEWNDEDRIRFADPGGESALRAASEDNPRNLPCPTCGWPNRLTPADRACGYQCDNCVNVMERGGEINYYEDE